MTTPDDYDYSEEAERRAHKRAIDLVRWWAKGYGIDNKRVEERVCEEIAEMLAQRLGMKEGGR